MLIRSSPARLERLRVPIGPLRVRWDHPLAANLRGLWVGGAADLCADISRQNAALTAQGSLAVSSGVEGEAYDVSASGTSGARVLFNTGSALSASLAGLTTFGRVQVTATNPDGNAHLFGLAYTAGLSPFIINAVIHTGTTGVAKFLRNSGGSYVDSGDVSGCFASHVPTSAVFAHDFGASATGWTGGVQRYTSGSSVSAPNFSGTSDIFAIGYDGVNSRNSQALVYIAGVAAHAWTAQDAALFEADPYGLVEQDRSFLSMLPAAAAAPEISVTGNGNAIIDGDATPSLTDHTDFGTTPQGTTKSRTFTITNSGDANLTISSVALSGTDAAEFTITTNPTGTIAPAGTGTLIVRADATTQGTFVATVTINSNDANEAAFDFAITVEVTEPAADDDGGIPFSPATAITFSPSGLLIR